MYNFQQKLKVLKAKIRTWNKEDFGNIFLTRKGSFRALTFSRKKKYGPGMGCGDERKRKKTPHPIRSKGKTGGYFLEAEISDQMAVGGGVEYQILP